MGRVTAGKGKAAALLFSLIGLVPLTAAQGSDLAEVLAATFLPQSVQIAGPQGILFGVFLPVLLAWVILYEGMRKAGFLSSNASLIVSIILALFLIPTGGYKLLSGFLFTIGGFFGFGAEQVGIPGVSGYELPIFVRNMSTVTRAMVASTIVGFFTWIFLNAGPVPGDDESRGMWKIFGEGGIDFAEYLLIGLMMMATWFTFGGFSLTIAAIGWALMFLMGFWLIQIYVEVQGGYIGALLGLIGVLILASLFRSISLFPDEIQAIANMVFQGAVGLIVILLVILVIAVYVVLFEWRPWE